ncbi:hypothetical protein BKA83DRAFT_4178261 [Pisolithus microcarpus]|nr:hypothetical protein BKA83DRAFT_4178261 [Pisolithus microcarpus]
MQLLITCVPFQFMSILLQSADVHFKVGRGQTEVHAERCRFDGMQSDIVIVDTPTFGSYWDPDDGEDVMRMWMESK